MATISKDFDRYTIHYIGGTSLQQGEPGADIDCFQGPTRVGLLRFFRDSVIMPANASSGGRVNLYFEMGRFHDVITFLRYEKPLRLVLNPDTGFGYVATAGTEPVGKQEGV